MFQFKSNNSTSTKRKFNMTNFGDKLLAWYHRYFTEITWFLIGNLSVQIVDALTKHDYVEALWCVVIAFINYTIWKRNR